MKKNHLAYILIGLAALILIAVAVLWLYEPAPAPESLKKDAPLPESPRRDAPPPGVATMNLPKLVHPTTVGLKAGETAEENITLDTRRNGPGMVHYAFSSRVKDVYSKEELPWPDGLNFSIEPSDFMAYPNETYTSNLTISTTPDLLQGEYVFRFYSLFEGVMEGGGWLKVIVS